MSHTLEAEDGTLFHYDYDGRGPVEIVMPDGRGADSISVEQDSLVEFVVEVLRQCAGELALSPDHDPLLVAANVTIAQAGGWEFNLRRPGEDLERSSPLHGAQCPDLPRTGSPGRRGGTQVSDDVKFWLGTIAAFLAAGTVTFALYYFVIAAMVHLASEAIDRSGIELTLPTCKDDGSFEICQREPWEEPR